MDILPLLCIVSAAFAGLTKGAGVLPDGPLNAAVGATVMFTTTLIPSDKPLFSVAWTFGSKNIITFSGVNNTGLEYEGRITLFMSTGSLELRNLALNDTGEYSVSIIRFGEAAKGGSTTLNVLEPVSNVTATASSTDLVEFNSSVHLSCSSSGSSLSFLWLNSSSEVTASDRVQLTDGGSTLTIVNVTRYDQGPFRCRVSNPVSNDTSDPITLSISYGPEDINLKISLSQEYYGEGSNITLSCSADSRPAALFHWFLNGDFLSDTGPELRLMNIQMSQSGNYSCQAVNNKTLRYETSQPAAVFVLTPVSNVVVTSNNTHLVEFSSSARLSCSSSGSSLSFLWLNSSSEVTASDRVQLTDGGSTLTIVNVTRYDQGPFRCNVLNGASSGISQPVNLFIQHGPDNVAITGPESVHVGDFTMLYCSTMSVPSSTFTWLYNGKPTSLHEAVYVIKSIKSLDSGTYTCSAINAATGLSQTVSHKLTVVDFSDCSLAAGRASFVTAGCLIIIATVCGTIVYGIRRKRVNNNYAAHQKEKLSVKENRSDVYKISVTSKNLSFFEA